MERVILKRLVVTLIAVWSIVFASQALASSSAKFTNPDKSISTYTANPDGSTTLVESETDGTINTYLNGNRLTVKSPDDTIFDTIVNSDGSRDTAVTYPGQPRLVLATIPYSVSGSAYHIPNNLVKDKITFNGLNEYSDKVVTFTVQKASGNTPVCSVSYKKITLTKAPWNFTYDPGVPDSKVHVQYCYGASDDLDLTTTPAFTINTSFLNGDNYAIAKIVRIGNKTKEDASIVITDAGGMVSNKQTIKANTHYDYNFMLAQPSSYLNNYNVVVASASYVTSFPLAVTYLWAALDTTELAMYAPCSHITWIYDPLDQPKTTSSKAIMNDISAALVLLSTHTHLIFTYSPDLSLATKPNVIKYDWKELPRGTSGDGGPDWITTGTLGNSDYLRQVSGNVDLSTTSSWSNNDLYAGAYAATSPQMKFANKKLKGVVPGRQWLIVHETMHALGFDHSLEVKSVMSAINSGESGLAKEDLFALNYFYPACTN
jgi:hypothetical protein